MCEHNQFYVKANVARLTDGDNGPVTGYSADIEIICIECHTKFEFIGMPGGYSPKQPMVNFDGTKARMPIKPPTL